jgi:hypothetical protein
MSAIQRVGILVLVVFAFVLGSVWRFAGAQGENAKVAVQKWEYRTSHSLIAKEMNELGDEGWEVAAAFGYGNDAAEKLVVYKRPKP